VQNLARAKAALVVAVALEKTNATPSVRCAREAMRRKLVWVEEQGSGGWGCSECAWVFNPAGLPAGKSLAEMMQNYQQQRDKEFAAHVCAGHRGARNTKIK
jgi:hypothetical protein